MVPGLFLCEIATSSVAREGQMGARALECRPWGRISTLFTVI